MHEHAVGLGLRREMVPELLAHGVPAALNFLEIAPENWLKVNPKRARQLRQLTEQVPFFCHGLSLSIGAPAPLDEAFIGQLKTFLDDHQIAHYSEHLSYCSGNGHLYDLMPIPFTEAAIRHVVERIDCVQTRLQRRLILENVSYYAQPGAEMCELTFLQEILKRADCELLLDVNNVYVNCINHGGDPAAFIRALPSHRIRYLHVAGHEQLEPQLIIDTHGAPVIEPVWQLLALAYQQHGIRPTLLERDFNLPPLAALLTETAHIRHLMASSQTAATTSLARGCA